MGFLLKALSLLFLLPVWGWGFLAILFASPGSDSIQFLQAGLFALLLPGIFFFSRSFFKGLFLCLGAFSLILIWWQTLQPAGDKEWSPDVARVAHGEIEGNVLTMHNVRNFHYSSEKDFEENWETRRYNIDELQGLDMFFSYWASEHIAHAIMSWDFGQDQHLAISIETRKDISQEYSAVKGFFKQFELSYVAADERDLVRLRTNFRKERVYAYRLQVSKERSRALLEDYLLEMNTLVATPRFYDALSRNCTTAIYLHTKAINVDNPPPMDWKILASGHLDELLYQEGVVSRQLPFASLRQRSRIDLKMQSHGEEQFSRILRQGLPKP